MQGSANGMTAPSDLLEAVDRARVAPGDVALWYTGGAGYIVKTASALIFVDPYCGPSLDETWVRNIPPAFDPRDVTRCDLILSTHEHADHCDPHALGPMLEGTSAPFAGPASSVEAARGFGWPDSRLRALAPGESTSSNGVTVTAVHALDPHAAGCLGYALQVPDGPTIVNMGDSLFFDGLGAELRRWRVDVLCVSVAHNPPDETFYMSEVDVVRAARDAQARVLMPHHWDLWQWVAMDPRRVGAVAPWYAPDARVVPAKFCQPVTIVRQGGATVVRYGA